MRSRKTKIGVGLAVVCFAAIALAALTASTRVQAAGPVGSGTASATKSVCGMGTGKKATGTPIKIGGIDMLIPGVDFTTVGKLAAAYFECVNDNGGINGHPIQYILYNEQLNPTQEAALATEADRERQGRRHRRQHELRRVRNQLALLQVQGVRRDRRRRPGRVLRHAVLRRGRTWGRGTATSAPPRRSSAPA